MSGTWDDMTETLRRMAADPELAYVCNLTLEVAADEIERLRRELAEARGLLRECRERIRSMPFENSEGERETYRIIARIDALLASDQPSGGA